MALPFLVPLLVGGALLGANVARNKDENILEGALKGALLGGGASTLGGALGLGKAAVATAAPSAATPVTIVGGKTALAAADAATIKSAAAFGSPIAEAAKFSSVPESIALADPVSGASSNFLQRGGAKLLATAKDKPLQTAQFASMVGSALSPPPSPAGGAPFNPGGVQPTPTVDETIGEMPVFVPKPLFDEMMIRSPEEMILLEEEMMARGLV
mgnify:CR=1 FL=1